MIKREPGDARKGDTGGQILKDISKDYIELCFSGDEKYKLVNEIKYLAFHAEDERVRLQALRDLADRIFGKAKERVDVTSDGEKITAGIFVPSDFKK